MSIAAYIKTDLIAKIRAGRLQGERLTEADVAVACAWRFAQFYDSAEVPAAKYPALVAYSRRAEALPEFASTPLD